MRKPLNIYNCVFTRAVQEYLEHYSSYSDLIQAVEKGASWLLSYSNLYILELILITYWQVWKERNVVILKDEQANVIQTRRNTWADFKDHKLAHRMAKLWSKGGCSKKNQMRPLVGHLKVNSNGASDKDSNNAGMGFIIRDSNARVIVAAATFHKCNSVLLAKLLAIRSAMAYIYFNPDLQQYIVIVESDSMKTLNLIKSFAHHSKANTHSVIKKFSFMSRTR